MSAPASDAEHLANISTADLVSCVKSNLSCIAEMDTTLPVLQRNQILYAIQTGEIILHLKERENTAVEELLRLHTIDISRATAFRYMALARKFPGGVGIPERVTLSALHRLDAEPEEEERKSEDSQYPEKQLQRIRSAVKSLIRFPHPSELDRKRLKSEVTDIIKQLDEVLTQLQQFEQKQQPSSKNKQEQRPSAKSQLNHPINST